LDSSTVFDPNGDLIAQGPFHKEALTYAESELNQLHRTGTRLPLWRDKCTSLVLSELSRIID
jgi:predicted amidohydrolase